ncbi:hypothetical protein [Aggregatibacter actinomycetemcomitans]|nr:hypothetical protein [Aggregatibacter actinomycetemcomitans]
MYGVKDTLNNRCLVHPECHVKFIA